MEKIVIYGLGDFYSKYKHEIESKYEVVAYVDKRERDLIEVVSGIDEVKSGYDLILITACNITTCFEIINILLNHGVSYNKIFLGIKEWGQYSELNDIRVTKTGKISIKKDDVILEVNNEDEFNNCITTLLHEGYRYHLSGNKKEVVLDIGMNIGDSALYFANLSKVVAVHCFEPFKNTFEKGKRNIERNQTKATVYLNNYGLSDCDETRNIMVNENMSCGQSTIIDINNLAKDKYEDWGLIKNNETKEEKIEVRKASRVLEKIIN